MIEDLSALRFIESPHLLLPAVQVRFPRSKARRIRKKWARRTKNWQRRPDPQVYRLADGTIIGHPATIARLRQLIAAAPAVQQVAADLEREAMTRAWARWAAPHTQGPVHPWRLDPFAVERSPHG